MKVESLSEGTGECCDRTKAMICGKVPMKRVEKWGGTITVKVSDQYSVQARYAATMPESTIPSKVPAPPMLAMPVAMITPRHDQMA